MSLFFRFYLTLFISHFLTITYAIISKLSMSKESFSSFTPETQASPTLLESELKNMPSLVQRLSKGESLLQELHLEELQNMSAVGKINDRLFGLFFNQRWQQETKHTPDQVTRRRRHLLDFAQRLFPYEVTSYADQETQALLDSPPDGKGCLLYFNHPSLTEALAALALPDKIPALRQKKILAPVNLPWFECLAKWQPDLEELGFILTPLISPSCHEKMRNLITDEKTRDQIGALKRHFESYFQQQAFQLLQEGGLVTIAPSASRAQHIFPKPPEETDPRTLPVTMSVFMAQAKRKKILDQFRLLPVGVNINHGQPRELNLFKKYTYCLQDFPLANDVWENNQGDMRKVNFDLLERLLSLTSEEYHFPQD